MKSTKRKLHFDAFRAVVAEIETLRENGYAKTANWSLKQACFHLGCTIPLPLKAISADPRPQTNPDVIKRFQHYADHDAPLPGITAPPGTEPPADAQLSLIDEYLAKLRSAEAFDGDYVELPNRGPIPAELWKAFLRGHAAHHLSYLIPN